MRSLILSCPLLPLLVLLALPPPAAAQGPTGRLWLDFGVGLGHQSPTTSPFASGGTGMWLGVGAGVRLDRQWFVGLEAGALGLHPSSANAGQDERYSTVWGEAATNVLVLVRYQPQGDRGWFFTAGGGWVLFHHQALEDIAGIDGGRVGSGRGYAGRAGYGWPLNERAQVVAQVSLEGGRVAMKPPFDGSVRLTAVTANVGVRLALGR